MSAEHGPISQFEIKPLLALNFHGTDLSFTNSSLYMVIALVLAAALLIAPTQNAKLIPGRWQSIPEILYQTITGMLKDTVGVEALKYFPFVFSIFIFVLCCNLLGMIPYSFTVTSHVSVTFILAILVFLTVTIVGFVKHGLHFFSLFAPAGVPKAVVPFIFIIELFAYLARPITLSLRLAANMMAGHILLKVIAGFVAMMGVFWGWMPVGFMTILTGFEIFVAVLQAYIFTILTCVYLNDAVNLH